MDEAALGALILQAWKANPKLMESLTEFVEAVIAERDEARERTATLEVIIRSRNAMLVALDSDLREARALARGFHRWLAEDYAHRGGAIRELEQAAAPYEWLAEPPP